MKKHYKLLDALSAQQALEWLQHETGEDFKLNDLLDLCMSGQCDVYVERDLPIEDSRNDGPRAAKTLSRLQRSEIYFDIVAKELVVNESYYPLFLPADMKTLVAKINDEAKPQNIAELNKSEGERTDVERVEGRVTRLTKELGKQPQSQPEKLTAGLSFPYATRELEAMRSAALKYWANYTPDMRQPTQKEVQFEICKLLGLSMADNSPPRKAVLLATAIKPDTLPEA